MSNIDVMLKKDYGKEWSDWMEANVYSQSDLARAIGVQRITVNRIASRKHKPSARTQKKFMNLVKDIEKQNRRWQL